MVDRSRLRQFMVESFNDDELADLIFDYFPNVRPLLGEGMTLSQKVRTLIDFADRHERLDHLVVVLEKARPEAYCEFFQTEVALPPEPETAERNPYQVFISYAGADAEFAARLAADLRARNVPIWIAPDSILPGEKWVAAIERGLRESGVFLLVLSPDGVDSKWVSQETQVAIMLENEGKMRVYPLRVRPAEAPLLLATRQHIPFDADYDRGLGALLAVLRPGGADQTVGLADFPVLIIDWPDRPNDEVALNKPLITVGRDAANDIVLDLPIISSRHLQLQTAEEGGALRVRATDLGSRNGTFVSGRQLTPNEPFVVEPGDVVNLGDQMGRSISLILRPGSSAGPLPAPRLLAEDPPAAPAAEREVAATTVPLTTGSGAVTAAAPAPLAGLPGKLPVWAYAAAALAVVALIALFALRGRGGERGGAPTAVVAAATEPGDKPVAVANETATAEPSPRPATAPTDAPAIAPPDAPTAMPTAAATATPTVAPTSTSTPEPTSEPTTVIEPTPEVAAIPTETSNFEISRASVLSFEALGEWLRDSGSSRADGALSISDEQAHSGAYALRLEYDFPGTTDDFVVFQAARPYRVANDRERRFLKVWALGDGSRLNLSAIVVDREGELWKVFLGEVSGTDWQQLDGYIGDTNWPSSLYGNRGNGVVDYPVRLRGFHLDDADSAFAGAGAIYIDDVTVE